MKHDSYKDKINLIIKTDGLLTNYIFTFIYEWVDKQDYEDPLKNLNPKQLQTVLLIFHMETLSLKTLAKVLKISKSTASALVDKLVQNGSVLRKQDPENRRNIIISINPKIQEHIQNIEKQLFNVFENIISQIGKEKFQQWFEIMSEVNQIINKQMR